LAELTKELWHILHTFFQGASWVDEVGQYLTAEVKVQERAGTWSLEHPSGIVYVPAAKKRRCFKSVKDTPPFQLCQYREYTDAIVAKCQGIYQKALKDLEQHAGDFCGHMTGATSKWMTFSPPDNQNNIKITCATEPCVNALVTMCLRTMPGPKAFQGVQTGVQMGSESQAAVTRRKRLDDDIAQIEAAQAGIVEVMKQSGYQITAEAFNQWEQELDKDGEPA